MLKMSVLQEIIDDPPEDVLELYSRLYAAHSYTFGDASVVGKVYATSMVNPPEDAVFVESMKPNVGENIIATCFVGQTVDEVTTYEARLGIFIRGYTSAQTVTTLTTDVLGKKLAQHIAEAMGYNDYIIVRPYSTPYYRPGSAGAIDPGWVMPLVIPPGVNFESSAPAGHYIDTNAAANTAIFANLVKDNPASHMTNSITVGGVSFRPPAWFPSNGDYSLSLMPLSTYVTDDQCWATVNDTVDTLQQQRIDACSETVANLGQACASLMEITSSLQGGYANIVELVGALSVFGNTIKDVTTRYNNATQYIPRP